MPTVGKTSLNMIRETFNLYSDMDMNLLNVDSAAGKYVAPEVSVMDVETEGILCQSGAGIGTSHEPYEKGGEYDL